MKKLVLTAALAIAGTLSAQTGNTMQNQTPASANQQTGQWQQNSQTGSNTGSLSTQAVPNQSTGTTATGDAAAVNGSTNTTATADVNAAVAADTTKSTTIIQEEKITRKKKSK